MSERVGAVIVVLGLGVLLLVVGALGWRQRISYNLGGWTAENSTPASRRAAQRMIGRHFMLAGASSVALATLISATPHGWTGPIVLVECGILLAIVAVGVVRGLNLVEPSQDHATRR